MADQNIIETPIKNDGENEIKMPKNTKANRYYYKNREQVLEKQRLARLAKKGVDITNISTKEHTPLEERRKKKLEFLGLLEPSKSM